jgi:hypothetical protein
MEQVVASNCRLTWRQRFINSKRRMKKQATIINDIMVMFTTWRTILPLARTVAKTTNATTPI